MRSVKDPWYSAGSPDSRSLMCSLTLVRNMLAGKREILLIMLRLCYQEATRRSAFGEAAGRLVGSDSGDSSVYS